jgi:cytochrome P450
LSFVSGIARGLKENKPYGFLRQWHNENGSMLSVNMIAMQSVSVVDPQVVKWVTRNDPARFTKGLGYESIKRGWLDHSLVLNEGEEWRRKRSIYNAAFKISAIRSYVPLFLEIAKTAAQQWQQSHEQQKLVDAVASFESVALEAIGQAGFGTQGMGKPGNKFAKSFVSYLDVLQDEITSPALMMLPKSWRQRVTKYRGGTHLETMNSESLRISGESGKVSSGVEQTRQNLVALIQESAAAEGEDIDPEQLARESNLFLFAGHDTTSASLAWAFASLAANPEVQQRAYEEVAQVEDLQSVVSDPRSLPYLGAIIRETLRLYPPASMVIRRTKFDEELGGYQIPAGTDLTLNIWCMHRDPKVFENADSFMPDRWVDADAASLKRMQDHWVPFMVGARSCIGQQFSLMEMRVVIATLLRKFSVQLESVPQVKQRMLLLPSNIKLRCTPRQ